MFGSRGLDVTSPYSPLMLEFPPPLPFQGASFRGLLRWVVWFTACHWARIHFPVACLIEQAFPGCLLYVKTQISGTYKWMGPNLFWMLIQLGARHCTTATVTPYLMTSVQLQPDFLWLLNASLAHATQEEWPQLLHSLCTPSSRSTCSTLNRWVVPGVCVCTCLLDSLCRLWGRGLPPCKANLCSRAF